MNQRVWNILILVATISGLGLAAWFGCKHYQKIEAARWLDDARDSFERKDLRTAALSLTQALKLNPTDTDAVAMMADLLEMESAPSAVEWRVRAAQLQPHDAEARFNWAQTAIKLGNLPSANDALAGIADNLKGNARYHKLAGALAWRLHHSAEAELHYAEAARLERTNDLTEFNLQTVRLSSTNPITAEAARLSLEQQATNTNVRLVALRQLIAYEEINRAWSKALQYSQEIVTNPAANYDDMLMHLELLNQAGEPDFATWLSQLEQTATNSTASAFALGKRLERLQNPTNVLDWIQTLPEDIQSAVPLSQLAADCCVALKQWRKLLETTKGKNWAEAEPSRLALVALAHRSLGEDSSSQDAWRAALEQAAYRLDGLSSLAHLAAVWGWEPERKQVLAQISSRFPNERLR